MKKLVAGGLAGVALGGAVLAAAAPASAEPWRHGYHGGAGAAAVVGAGILGLAVGAAIADRPQYYAPPPPPPPPPPRYYAPVYYGGCRPAWRWDPYIGRHVRVDYCY